MGQSTGREMCEGSAMPSTVVESFKAAVAQQEKPMREEEGEGTPS